MIKVLANSTEQAIEIIQAFENSDAKIVIDIKENTTTENRDVVKPIVTGSMEEVIQVIAKG